jgi:hypothetical protein
MSLLDWYRHKADQCRQLAQRVRNPKERSKIQDEQREWLQIANKDSARTAKNVKPTLNGGAPGSPAPIL